MNLTKKTVIALTVAALVSWGGSLAYAEDDHPKMNAANQALVDGKVEEALAQYDAVAEEMPASPLLAYNRGVALYRQGQVDQARQAFTSALDTDDPALAAKAGFNLGNCHYAAAVQQSETERAVAIDSLQTAIAHYRSALKSNSADTDSRTNIELAQRLINKLQEQEKQEQQQQQDQQQQDKQQQDQQDQNQDSSQSEQEQSDQSDSHDGKSDEQQSDQSESDQSNSDENESDQSSSEQDENQQDESDESKSDESKSDEQKSDENGSDQQNEEENRSEEESNSSNAEQSEQESSDDQNSSESQNEEQDQQAEQNQPGQESVESQSGEQQEEQPSQPQPGQEQQDDQPEPKSGQQMSAGQNDQQDRPEDGQQPPGYGISETGELGETIDKEEAMKMLQAIRDRDMVRRMQKLNETRRRYRPVDRDW